MGSQMGHRAGELVFHPYIVLIGEGIEIGAYRGVAGQGQKILNKALSHPPANYPRPRPPLQLKFPGYFKGGVGRGLLTEHDAPAVMGLLFQGLQLLGKKTRAVVGAHQYANKRCPHYFSPPWAANWSSFAVSTIKSSPWRVSTPWASRT